MKAKNKHLKIINKVLISHRKKFRIVNDFSYRFDSRSGSLILCYSIPKIVADGGKVKVKKIRKEKYKSHINETNYKKYFNAESYVIRDDAEFVGKQNQTARKDSGSGDEYDWKFWIEKYLSRVMGHTKTMKELSPSTLKQNKRILYPYYDWLIDYDSSSKDILNHIDMGVEWFNEYYRLRLSGELVDEKAKVKWSPSTIHTAFRNVRGFYNFVANGHRDKFPFDILRKLQLPKPQNKRDAINSNEFEKIIDFIIEKRADVFWGKFILLLRLQLKSGMRVGELVNIRNRNVDEERKQIKIIGKGSVERVLQFISKDDELIWNDILDKKHRGTYLFHRTKVQFYPKQRIKIEVDIDENKPTTESYYAQRFRQMRTLLGLRGKGIITSHSLRRYFITKFVKDNGNRDLVMQIVGHKSRRMVDYYLSDLIDEETTTTINIGI